MNPDLISSVQMLCLRGGNTELVELDKRFEGASKHCCCSACILRHDRFMDGSFVCGTRFAAPEVAWPDKLPCIASHSPDSEIVGNFTAAERGARIADRWLTDLRRRLETEWTTPAYPSSAARRAAREATRRADKVQATHKEA
eukprot:CAMPEP_0113662490 /NCGR_PEP_ID=MMETSP0038_2-20120614/603_1 /TAXON_ID=2898 /ORGANISM="Cryptomonas paramecium" /LENGTH=141 /DNA_ID=CAMNT_0000577387 /DNA_START=111 /DNA_END=533 /DNA_ORIENTATION=+ /assembly_acc=CAM_ASM_000170